MPTITLSSVVPAHSITTLRYRLHYGPVDLSPLVIRKSRQFLWEYARVTAFVLGASHAITVALPDGREFTELLTCLPPHRREPQPPACFDNDWAIPAISNETVARDLACSGWMSGIVRLTRFPLVEGADRLGAEFTSDNTLHEPFVLPSAETAWTRVAWRFVKSDLQVETIHTYPEEGLGVRSETCLHLPEAA